MIQVDISCHTSGQDINEYLRLWQSKYTKRKIINMHNYTNYNDNKYCLGPKIIEFSEK